MTYRSSCEELEPPANPGRFRATPAAFPFTYLNREVFAFKLHVYFRSIASYRARIALNLKRIAYQKAFHHLRRPEQTAPGYLTLNPQGLLPTLQIEDMVLTQSLAICEYLDERDPEPALLPASPMARARVHAFSQAIACDIHPVQNLKLRARLRSLGLAEEEVTRWAQLTLSEGLAACDKLLPAQQLPFCFRDTPRSADICLVPQLVNARRFGLSLDWPRLLKIEVRCLALEAFARAAPDRQPDAE